MKVIVYVEGPSDQYALETLLAPLLEKKRQEGVRIRFTPWTRPGHKKRQLVLEGPKRAANTLRSDPATCVVVMPDLHPKDEGFPHETAEELIQGISGKLREALENKGVDDERIRDRFRAFCFKHDLEALLLACREGLRRRLGVESLDITWRQPVEQQNHDTPPKRVIEQLFRAHQQTYRATVDAPAVLTHCTHEEVVNQCPECFAPFVAFLEELKPWQPACAEG